MSDHPSTPPGRSHGILPSQDLRELVASAALTAAAPITEDQIQPASLDLRLGEVAWRVRAGFLPGARATVMEGVEAVGMHRLSLAETAVLERGCVYIIPLVERLQLPPGVSGAANPKSSTGRLDLFTRLIADYASEFDEIPAGYDGPLYAEVSPRTFSVVVQSGMRLNQLRLRRGGRRGSDTALKRLFRNVRLVDAPGGSGQIQRGLAISVDLSPAGDQLVGWRARRHTDLVDLSRIDHYEATDFWEPVRPDRTGAVVLNPGDFYILASKEAVTVPPDHAAEMRAYDTRVGEFRVHYAGFFDPGFGYADCGGAGSRAVLEVRSFEVPFIVRDGQRIGRLVYEPLTARPDKLYGLQIGSSYQRQGLMLAKQFRRSVA